MSATSANQFITQLKTDKSLQTDIDADNIGEIIEQGNKHGFEFDESEFERAVRDLATEELARKDSSNLGCPDSCPKKTLMTQ